MDMNALIASNITSYMKKIHKKQVDLAEYLGISRQTVSKMLTGARSINAIELKQIAEFCGTTMEKLTEIPATKTFDMDQVHVFMGKVKTAEAIKGIEIADELIDLFLFHDQVQKNGMEMAEWSDLI